MKISYRKIQDIIKFHAASYVNNQHIESRCPLYVTMKENKSFYNRIELIENRTTQFGFYFADVL